MLEWLKDFLRIYTWRELWVVVACPVIITGVWGLLSYFLGIPNDLLRSICIWAVLLILFILGGVFEASWKEGVEKYSP